MSRRGGAKAWTKPRSRAQRKRLAAGRGKVDGVHVKRPDPKP